MDRCTGTRLHGACCTVISSRCMLHAVLVIVALRRCLRCVPWAWARRTRENVSRCSAPRRCMVHDAAAGYTAAYCYSVPALLSLAHARLCRATAGQGHCCAPSVAGLLCTSKSLPRRPCLLGTHRFLVLWSDHSPRHADPAIFKPPGRAAAPCRLGRDPPARHVRLGPFVPHVLLQAQACLLAALTVATKPSRRRASASGRRRGPSAKLSIKEPESR
jgi:hypothetical protein